MSDINEDTLKFMNLNGEEAPPITDEERNELYKFLDSENRNMPFIKKPKERAS